MQVKLFSLGEGSELDHDGYRDRRFAKDSSWGALRRLGRSTEMRDAVFGSEAHLFHTHGMWMMPNVYPARAASLLGRPLVLTPRGMLAPDALKFSRLQKSLFWQIVQKPSIKAVKCFHATAEQEYHEIRAFGLRQPVAVIPNGIDIPIEESSYSDVTSASSCRPYILSLGRIHPKKGLDRLVTAWSRVERAFPAWELRIVGSSERGYREELVRLASQLAVKRIRFSEAIFGEEKNRLLRDAELFVLPTLNENFGMVVAESLVAGTPVISTKGAPWAGLQKHRCGWWIDQGVDAIVATLHVAMSLSVEDRFAMGARGRAWMENDFSWTGVSAKMAATYEWLIGGGDRPAWVMVN